MSPYHWTLIILGVIVGIGVAAIVILDSRHGNDANLTTITILIGFLAPTIAALLSLAKARENESTLARTESKVDAAKEQVDTLHKTIEKGLNGVQEASLDAGIREGRKIERAVQKDKQ